MDSNIKPINVRKYNKWHSLLTPKYYNSYEWVKPYYIESFTAYNSKFGSSTTGTCSKSRLNVYSGNRWYKDIIAKIIRVRNVSKSESWINVNSEFYDFGWVDPEAEEIYELEIIYNTLFYNNTKYSNAGSLLDCVDTSGAIKHFNIICNIISDTKYNDSYRKLNIQIHSKFNKSSTLNKVYGDNHLAIQIGSSNVYGSLIHYGWRNGGELERYSLTLSHNTGGTVSASPAPTSDGYYLKGTVVTVTATPSNYTYEFSHWEGEIYPESVTTVVMNESKTLRAIFKKKSYLLQLSVNDHNGGTALISGGETSKWCEINTSVYIYVTTNYSYRFTGWSGDSTSTATGLYIYMDGNKSITANFIKQYYLTFSSNDTLLGSVSGGGWYDTGEWAYLSVTPNSGCYFSWWGGTNGGDVIEWDKSIYMDENKSVIANFARNTVTLSLSVSPHNSGTVAGAGTYDYGGSAGIRATPSSGYSFSYWSGDISSTDNPTTVYMDGNKNITANFGGIYHNLYLYPNRGERGQVKFGLYGDYNSGNTYPMLEGTWTSIDARPFDGYKFVRWNDYPGGMLARPDTSAANDTFDFYADATITAVFELDAYLTISRTESWYVNTRGESITVIVTTNSEYTVECNMDGCSIWKNGNVVTLTVTPNYSGKFRSARVYFKIDGVTYADFYVSQQILRVTLTVMAIDDVGPVEVPFIQIGWSTSDRELSVSSWSKTYNASDVALRYWQIDPSFWGKEFKYELDSSDGIGIESFIPGDTSNDGQGYLTDNTTVIVHYDKVGVKHELYMRVSLENNWVKVVYWVDSHEDFGSTPFSGNTVLLRFWENINSTSSLQTGEYTRGVDPFYSNSGERTMYFTKPLIPNREYGVKMTIGAGDYTITSPVMETLY